MKLPVFRRVSAERREVVLRDAAVIAIAILVAERRFKENPVFGGSCFTFS